VFIPSKGRFETRLTARGFDLCGIPYTIFVEPQEYDAYAAAVGTEKLHKLPHSNKGVTVTRNYIWDYAASLGVKRYWSFDDNIGTTSRHQGVCSLWRFHRNSKIPVKSAAPLCAIEDWADRYLNVVVAGMNYFMFVPRKKVLPPIYLNTRVYSNMLIDTFACGRNGRLYRFNTYYNEDTDLCLRILKDGRCTAQFNSFLIYKQTTMKIKGGNTPNYQKDLPGSQDGLMADGRYRMAKELYDAHPDVTQITRRWGRWQHWVDYSKFRNNLLVKDPSVVIPDTPNNYGLDLEVVEKALRRG
jgi:hypothetical protein